MKNKEIECVTFLKGTSLEIGEHNTINLNILIKNIEIFLEKTTDDTWELESKRLFQLLEDTKEFENLQGYEIKEVFDSSSQLIDFIIKSSNEELISYLLLITGTSSIEEVVELDSNKKQLYKLNVSVSIINFNLFGRV